MSELRCYYCGKPIENEKDITMRNVSVGWFNSERKPFHTTCWEKHHGRKIKRDAIGYIAVADGSVLIIGGFPLFVIFGTIGLIVIGLCFAFLIYLVVKYYRTEE